MTRIIGGRLRGRQIRVPASGTRPTSDRVREAVFSAIEARMDPDGLAVLDLFAGSGALGIEAASRGARAVRFVEASAKAASVLRGNTGALAELGVRAEIDRGTLPGAVSGGCPEPGGYDLVFADPPYDLGAEVDTDTLTALADEGWLAADSLVVWERSGRAPEVRWPGSFEVTFERRYGDTVVEMAWFGGPAS